MHRCNHYYRTHRSSSSNRQRHSPDAWRSFAQGPAAAKADRVLNAFVSGKATGLREAGSLTAWGESRVFGCKKFNLGGGYRLIFSRRGGTVMAHFVGNHEECHRWLMANRGLDLRPDRRVTPVARECAMGEEDTSQDYQSSPTLPEITLSDRELRLVFGGLCGVVKSVIPEPEDSDCPPGRGALKELPVETLDTQR
jgi:hypothetical protein